MPTRSDRVAAVGMLLAVAIGTAACGGSSSDPHPLPPITSSATASTPGPSTSPTDSRQTALAAATAVVRKYYALLEQPSDQVDPQAFGELMTPGCPCRKFIATLERLRARKQHFFGTAHVIALRPNLLGARAAQVLVAYDASAGGIATQSGRIIHRTAPLRRAALNYELRRYGRKWLISDVVVVNSGRQ